ncbi:MAG: hypothetical protein H7062_07620, partial [Candidatus Saccharimonas sp.]|nr:hypothetical protein [Planctomycetaceae bacterium]
MRRLWFGTAAVMLCLVQALAGWQIARADENAIGEKLLPKDTLLFFTIPDVSGFKEQFDKSSTGALFRDAEFKPFLDDVKKKIEELSQKVQDELGVSIDDLLELPDGEITFALMEKPARKLSVVLMVDYGESKETVGKLLKKMHEALESEAEHSKEDVDDVEVNVFTFKDSPPENPFKTLAYFNDTSYLVFSSEVAALKEVLDRWEGDSDDTLATNDVFKYCMDRCKDESGEPTMKFFVNPIGLVQAGLNMAQAFQPQVGMVSPFLPMLGFDKLKGLGGASYVNTGDFDSVSKTFVYADSPTGVLNVFQFPATEITPPKWVSSGVSMYFGGNWNVAGAYQAIEGLVDMFQGRGALARLMDQAANAGPGIHPKKDVLDLLDGKFHVVQGIEEGDGDEPLTQKFFVALAVKDGAKAKKLLATVAKSDGSPVESREFNGETIYEVDLPGGDQKVSFAVAEGHLVVTNDTVMLEGMLRGTGSGTSLADSAPYKKIAKHFPA